MANLTSQQIDRLSESTKVASNNKDTDGRNLSVEKHYQKDVGDFSSKVLSQTNSFDKVAQSVNKDTDIAVCQKVLIERGTDKKTVGQLTKAVGEKSAAAVKEPNQEHYAKDVVAKAQERNIEQEQRQPRENTKHKTANYHQPSIEQMKVMKDINYER